MFFRALIATIAAASTGLADERVIYLEAGDGNRIPIALLTIADSGEYDINLNTAVFSDHFLSMRPFKCLEGPGKHWCHVPYPYAIKRDISTDFTDLEYDTLFVWKDATDYGIDMWNGVYYRIGPDQDGRLVGRLHEMDMDLLSVPPADGVMRPLRPQDIHESDPDGHWLPRLIIE